VGSRPPRSPATSTLRPEGSHASLAALEVPQRGGGQAYHRFWLPAAIAKGGSARWAYVPDGIARKIGEYVETDRADVIEQARARDAYDGIPWGSGMRFGVS
jgi:hypothetical protein